MDQDLAIGLEAFALMTRAFTAHTDTPGKKGRY
jgi:hypothetical protein